MSKEARQLEIFGEKLYFETNTDRVDSNGPAAYILASQTSDKVKYNQSLHEGSGDSRIYAEKRLQIESGVKSESNNQAFNVRVKMVMVILQQRTVTLRSQEIKL